MSNGNLRFYEFFSGGGMARLGLGERWHCRFANDCCEKKARAYRANFGDAAELVVRDIRKIAIDAMPDEPLLVWASFPCQDLSLAGNGAGLKGERSGTFWSFWRLMKGLANEGRAARVIVLENVVGAITSNGGRDFRAIVQAISDAGYRVGALVINAVHFVPQSRPRLFIVAVDASCRVPAGLKDDSPTDLWHPKTLRSAYAQLPSALQSSWLWWHLPVPIMQRKTLADIIESTPTGVEWHPIE